jgi:hypothetical protein
MRWASVPSPAQRSAIVYLAGRTARGRPNLPAVQIAWAEALEGVGEQEEARPLPGALRIGALPSWLDAPPPWPVIDVELVPGTFVLFPSFVPHETIPSGSAETRISVAFDVARAQ